MTSSLVRARRTLMAQPLLVGALDPPGYTLVAPHVPALQEWFENVLGWKLDHDRVDRVVRLHKTHRTPPATAPVTGAVALDKRRLVVALVAAAHLAAEDGVSVVRAATLRDRILETCDARDDLPALDLAASQQDRYDLTAALRWLVETVGAADLIDGDVADAAHNKDGDALLRVRPSVLAVLLSSEAPDDTSTPADEAVETVVPASAEGRSRLQRTTAVRTFADRPALYRDELLYDDGQLQPGTQGLLAQQLRRVAADLGLAVEQRTEGWAGIDTDPARPLSATAFPYRTSTASHCALLLAEHAADLARAGVTHVTRTELRERTAALVESHGTRCNWATASRESPGALAADAARLLEDHDLLRPDGDAGWRITPVCARYAAQEPAPADPAPAAPPTLPLEHEDD